MLAVENIHVRYGQIEVLHGVPLHVQEGEIVAVLGANGAGKSTLIKTLIGWLEPSSGEITLQGERLTRLSAWERVKRGMAIVPEGGRLFRDLSVEDNLRLGAYLQDENALKEQIEIVYTLFPILAERRKQVSKTLSGGEQQRVLIARSLAQEAKVLLLDEPTSNLDIKHQLEVMNLTKKLVTEEKIAAAVAIHDLNLAFRYCDKIVMLKAGKVFAAGEAHAVLTQEILRKVYGVEVVVNQTNNIPYIIPIAPLQ